MESNLYKIEIPSFGADKFGDEFLNVGDGGGQLSVH